MRKHPDRHLANAFPALFKLPARPGRNGVRGHKLNRGMQWLGKGFDQRWHRSIGLERPEGTIYRAQPSVIRYARTHDRPNTTYYTARQR